MAVTLLSACTSSAAHGPTTSSGASPSAGTTAPGSSTAADSSTLPGSPTTPGSPVGSSSTTTPAPTTTTLHASPPTVPAPPAPAALPSGTPAEQAVALSSALATGGDGVEATWLAVFAAAGVPVLDTSATAADGSDRMGPHWWQVWDQIPVSGQGTGIRLDELLQFIADKPGQPASGLGAAVLQDLRTVATGTDPTMAFLAQFVGAHVKARTGVDPLDPATPVETVILDGETAQLVGWSVARGIVARVVAPAGTFGRMRPLGRRPLAARRDSVDCGSLFGGPDATYWVNWFANKLSAGSGVGIFGLGSLPTLWNALSEVAPGLISSADKAASVNKASARLNVLTSLLTLLMQMDAIKLNGFDEPTPLDRTNGSGADDHQAKSTFELSIDPSSLPDGNSKAMCGLSFLLNAAGIQFQFPANGKLAGVEVLVTPMQGFGQGLGTGYVRLVDSSDLKQVTNSTGAFDVNVIGIKQKHDIPSTNPRFRREYSMGIAAQPGVVNGNNIFNTFFDGLTATDATGAAAGALDVAQTIHWDLGEQISQLDDWIAGYTIDQVVAEAYHITGRVCDLERPFHLTAQGDLHGGTQNDGTFTIDKSGWDFTGVISQGGHAVQSDATGPTTYLPATDTAPPGIRVGAGSWSVTAPIIGKVPLGPGGSHIDGFQLQLTPTTDCDPNSQ